jgi:NhaP-type Na+/H+ or K+/H+ antiporter
MPEYFKIESYNLLLIAAGSIALLAAVIPVIFEKRHITPPIIYLIVGITGYFICPENTFEPFDNIEIVKRVTEFVVLVALTNAGLKIKDSFKWETWKYSFRLLVIAMPITIVAASYLGWWILGLAPATALLFGALISPTDPVLASELQTSQPSKDDTSTIKLGLTSEAGMNDGLAFPFTYLAIMAATEGLDYKKWIGQWFLHDFIIKIAIGLVVGLLGGWLLRQLVHKLASKDELTKISRGILSLGLTLLPYALTETIGGYGFIAVFVAACIFSRHAMEDEHMDSLHDFNEELEGLVVALLFLVTGIYIAANYEMLLDFRVTGVALLMILIVRPVAGYISLIKTDLIPFQKFVMSFYGMRGIGSIFYLAYALTSATFSDSQKLLEVTMVTIFFSILIHGFSSRAIQKKIHAYNPKEAEAEAES